MRAPDLRTRALGHPITVVGMLGLMGLGGYAAYNDPQGWLLLVVMLYPLNKVINANGRLVDHKLWEREWGSMSDLPVRSPTTRWVRNGVTLAIPLALIAWAEGYITIGNAGAITTMIGPLALLIAGAVGVWMCARATARLFKRKPKPKPTTPIVVVSIRQPLLAVPSMKVAYDRLPAHCWAVLGRDQ